jgi:hypothetical protein
MRHLYLRLDPVSLLRWALLPRELAELVLQLVPEVIESGGAGSL